MNITFKSLDETDLGTVHRWLQHTHVRQFWDDGDRTITQVADHYCKTNEVQRFIFFFDQQAAGYIQFYPIDQRHNYAKFSKAEHESIGIDFFIGEPQFLGRNLAIQVLSQFISLYGQNSSRILVDPEIPNHKAIHLYHKYGFKTIATFTRAYKQHQLMAIDIRRTARAIILNSNEKILLIQINTQPLQSELSHTASSFWVTVGGKIEKNESPETALIRELREEAGMITPPHFKFLAWGEQILSLKNFPTRFIEKFFIMHTDEVDLKNTELTEEERRIIKNYRWWSISELKNTSETIFPPCLASLIETYLQNQQNWIAREIPL